MDRGDVGRVEGIQAIGQRDAPELASQAKGSLEAAKSVFFRVARHWPCWRESQARPLLHTRHAARPSSDLEFRPVGRGCTQRLSYPHLETEDDIMAASSSAAVAAIGWTGPLLASGARPVLGARRKHIHR